MKKLISLLSLSMLLSVNVLAPISYATENLGGSGTISENGSGMSENDNMSFRGSEATEESSKGQTGNTQDFYSTSGASASPQNGEGNGQTPQSDNNVSSGTVAKDSEISPLDEGGTVELSEFELQDSSVDTGKLQLDEHYIQNQEEYIEENSLYVQQMQGNKDDSVMMMRNIANYEDGIYDVLDSKARTVKYGDIQLTISLDDVSARGYDVSTLGGDGDNIDNKYDSGNDRTLRRGPCDEGWHVPSMGEWIKLVYSYCMINGDCNVYDYEDGIIKDLNEENLWGQPDTWNIQVPSIFYDDVKIEESDPGMGRFFSQISSSYVNGNGVGFSIRGGDLYIDSYSTIISDYYGDSSGSEHFFRCFKDSAEIEDVYYNLDFNVDENTVQSYSLRSGKKINKITDPKKEGYIFLGWYEDPEFGGEEYDFPKFINEDITLYAKRQKFERQNIFIPDPDNPTKGFTIMDRNIGATDVGKRGYYYKGPDVYSDYVSENERWGGELDSEENERGLDLDNDEKRQGPCPKGWHVPSIGEWNKVLEYRLEGYNRDNNTTYIMENRSGLSYLGESLGLSFSSKLKIPKGDDRINGGTVEGGVYYRYGRRQSFSLISSSVATQEGNLYVLYGNYSRYCKTNSYPGKDCTSWRGYTRTDYVASSDFSYQIRCFANKNQNLIFLDDEGNEILSGNVPFGEKWSWEGIDQPIMKKEGYSFLGWSLEGSEELFDFGTEAITSSIKLVPRYMVSQFTISFVDEDGNIITEITQDYDTAIQKPANPTKNGYEFIGWSQDIPDTMPAENLTITAQWKKKSSSWSGGGGGGGGMKKDNCPNEDLSPSYYDGEYGENGHGSAETNTGNTQDSSDKSSEGHTGSVVDSSAEPQNDSSVSSGATAKDLEGEELFNMHQRAYDNGLTIYAPGEDAKFDQPLTRQQMAKISSIFGTKFLNQKADASEGKIMECSQYKDLSKSKGEMRGYVIQSCLMKNMGYAYDGVNLIKKFKPYDKMSVAQASVILSRMAWGTKYVISPKMWYQGHMQAVYDHGLIDDISDPQREITRGEAFMMMYRLSQMMETEKQ